MDMLQYITWTQTLQSAKVSTRPEHVAYAAPRRATSPSTTSSVVARLLRVFAPVSAPAALAAKA